MLVNQSSPAPTRKVGSGMVGGGATVVGAPLVVLWGWGLVSDEPMPIEVAVFLTGAIVWAVQSAFGYLTRERT